MAFFRQSAPVMFGEDEIGEEIADLLGSGSRCAPDGPTVPRISKCFVCRDVVGCRDHVVTPYQASAQKGQ